MKLSKIIAVTILASASHTLYAQNLWHDCTKNIKNSMSGEARMLFSKPSAQHSIAVVPAADSMISRKLRLNWELAIGQSYFTNKRVFENRLNTDYMPPGMQYNVSLKVPVIRSFDRFGVRMGVGPRLSSFGLNSIIAESNNLLVITPIPTNSTIITSFFQQVFVDFPVSLYYETKSDRKGRSLSVEWGGIFGVQVYNRWKTFEKINNIIVTNSKEDLSQFRDFQFGNSIKLVFVKNRKKFSSGFFAQGVYYSTNLFHQASGFSSESYEVKLGVQLTLNRI